MSREKDFLNYLDGTLSVEEKARFEEALNEDASLQSDFNNYQRIVQMEQEKAKEHFELDERFVSKVMAEIKYKPSLFRRLLMEIKNPSLMLKAGFGSLATVTLCFALIYGPEYQAYQAGILQPEAMFSPDTSEGDTSEESGIKENQGAMSEAGPTVLHAIANPKAGKSDSQTIPRNQQISADSGALLMDTSEKAVTHPKSARTDFFTDKGGSKLGGAAHQIPPMESRMSRGLFVQQEDTRWNRRQSYEQYYGRHIVESNTERYGEFIENSPILTSNEPMSTFSIDVDTGSYTNARRFLRAGQLPPANAVRIEEFINYFDYHYPTTQGQDPFTANFEMAPSPDGSGMHLLKIGVQAQESGYDGSEKPWNLVFLIDVSGSMNSADKLPLVQRSLTLLVNNMRQGDTLSIVTYAHGARTVLSPSGIEKKSQILDAINMLSAGGGTHGSAGIHQAYNAAEQAFIANGVNRVILATDGDFNVGTTGTEELIKLIEQKRKSGITLTTLGFGTNNYNEAMMEQIANKGNGNYFYIDNFSEARKVFEHDLHGTLEVVAKDVKLQIEFNPEHIAQYRLVGYENRKLRNQDFANDKIDAGEIGAGHSVTALYEIILTGTEAAQRLVTEYRYKKPELKEEKSARDSNFAAELAFLKIRYKEPQGNRSKLLNFPLNRNVIQEKFTTASSDFRFTAAVSAFAHLLRGSQYEPELSFSEVAQLAKEAKGEDPHGYRQEFIELVQNAAASRR
ncbi:VWA domain-containing protein [bacterium]|nr:VWA domain-containing protein [bacterium]